MSNQTAGAPIPTPFDLLRWPLPLAFFIGVGVVTLLLITLVIILWWYYCLRNVRKERNENRAKNGTKRPSQPKQQSKQAKQQSKQAKKRSGPKCAGGEEEDVSIIIPSDKELSTLPAIIKESVQQKTIPKSPLVKPGETVSMRAAMERSKGMPSCTVVRSETKSKHASMSLQEHSAKVVVGALENMLVQVKSDKKQPSTRQTKSNKGSSKSKS